MNKNVIKRTSLMVGDWVEFETMTSNFLCGKVEEIGKDCITVDTVNAVEDVPFEKVGQIIATPDILRKNGFENCDVRLYRNSSDLHLRLGDYTIRWYAYVNHEAYVKGDYLATFSFVHELQHILRVMGYNSLADNFKI